LTVDRGNGDADRAGTGLDDVIAETAITTVVGEVPEGDEGVRLATAEAGVEAHGDSGLLQIAEMPENGTRNRLEVLARVGVLEEGGGSSRRGVVLRGIQLKLEPKGKYKVSGKGDKPIIDISGGAVTETFAEHISACSPKTPVVEVNYSKGLIAIQPAGCR
jgi:hypothetical protein